MKIRLAQLIIGGAPTHIQMISLPYAFTDKEIVAGFIMVIARPRETRISL